MARAVVIETSVIGGSTEEEAVNLAREEAVAAGDGETAKKEEGHLRLEIIEEVIQQFY